MTDLNSSRAGDQTSPERQKRRDNLVFGIPREKALENATNKQPRRTPTIPCVKFVKIPQRLCGNESGGKIFATHFGPTSAHEAQACANARRHATTRSYVAKIRQIPIYWHILKRRENPQTCHLLWSFQKLLGSQKRFIFLKFD